MVLGHVCERCAKLHPEVEQVIVPLRSEEQLEAIASGRVDVTEWPQSNSVGNYGLSFKSLVESPHVCVVRRQHPLAQVETVSLGDLENLDVTMLDRGRCCNADHLRDLIERDYPEIRLLPSQFDASQRLVGTANDLVIVMPRVFAAGNLDENQVMRPLEVDIRVSVGLVFRGEETSEALGKFWTPPRRHLMSKGAPTALTASSQWPHRIPAASTPPTFRIYGSYGTTPPHTR